MKRKFRFGRDWNLYYKDIHIHPFCDYYFSCERMDGETAWYIVYKHPPTGKFLISREEVKERLEEEMGYWYK